MIAGVRDQGIIDIMEGGQDGFAIREEQSKSCDDVVDWSPPVSPKVTVGKNAARATPLRAVAAAGSRVFIHAVIFAWSYWLEWSQLTGKSDSEEVRCLVAKRMSRRRNKPTRAGAAHRESALHKVRWLSDWLKSGGNLRSTKIRGVMPRASSDWRAGTGERNESRYLHKTIRAQHSGIASR